MNGNGPIAAMMDLSEIPTPGTHGVGEIDVIKNIFEAKGRSPQKNGIVCVFLIC